MENDETARQAARRLGAYIKAQREEQGLSIRGLAARAGIDASGLTGIERGTYAHAPRADVLHRLAVALNVPLIELFACLGYETHDLFSHIRSLYALPDEAITDAVAYIERLAATYSTAPAESSYHDGTDQSLPQ